MATRAQAKATTDHEEIRRWAEERGGRPAHVRGTGGDGDIGILRIDFPGYSGEDSLEEISWDDWFKKFDELKLALLYQDTTAGGQKSNFNKLIARETAEARERGETRAARRRGAARGRVASRRAAGTARGKRTATAKAEGRGTKLRQSSRRGTTRGTSGTGSTAARRSAKRQPSKIVKASRRAESTRSQKQPLRITKSRSSRTATGTSRRRGSSTGRKKAA